VQPAILQYHDLDIGDACAIQKFSADFVKPVFNHVAAPVLGEKSWDGWQRHNTLKSSGTSPNFRKTVASLKSPVAGSPVRLNATAPV